MLERITLRLWALKSDASIMLLCPKQQVPASRTNFTSHHGGDDDDGDGEMNEETQGSFEMFQASTHSGIRDRNRRR